MHYAFFVNLLIYCYC